MFQSSFHLLPSRGGVATAFKVSATSVETPALSTVNAAVTFGPTQPGSTAAVLVVKSDDAERPLHRMAVVGFGAVPVMHNVGLVPHQIISMKIEDADVTAFQFLCSALSEGGLLLEPNTGFNVPMRFLASHAQQSITRRRWAFGQTTPCRRGLKDGSEAFWSPTSPGGPRQCGASCSPVGTTSSPRI